VKTNPGPGLLILLIGTFAATDAQAFCRSGTGDAAPDENGCPSQGVPIYWRSECVGVHMDAAASEHLTLAQSQALLTQAFATWTAAGGACVPSLNVIPLEPAVDPVLGATKAGPNENDVFIRDSDWPYEGSLTTYELVTVTHGKGTGEMLDADIELNGDEFPSLLLTDAERADPTTSNALRRIFVHAAGHFLGFAHSLDTTSVMYSNYSAGDDSPPELTDDDAAGMCTVYPPDGERPTLDSQGNAITVPGTVCSLSELSPAGSCSSSSALRLDHGCSVSRVGESSESPLSVAALGLLGLCKIRNRRRSRPA
jgi:hypothetical protein